MTDVFISYSWDNRGFARAIYHRLRADGLSVWMDYDEIEDGGELESVIRSAIQKCAAFLLISSEAAIRSDYVNKEVDWALAELANRPSLTLLPIAIEQRSYHPKLTEFNHIRFSGFLCFEEGYLRCRSILRRHLVITDPPPVDRVIVEIFREFPALAEWLQPLRNEGRIRIAAVQAVPRFEVPQEIIDLAFILLCDEAIYDDDKCYLYLSIASEVICKFGYGFSALWARFLPGDLWLKTDKQNTSPSNLRQRLCLGLSEIHNYPHSHQYFVHLMNLVEPFDYIALTFFLRQNHHEMSAETTERLISLLIRKNPQGSQLPHIEAVSMFYRCFPENSALAATLQAWMEPSEFLLLGHAYFLDELKIYADEFGANKGWIEEKFTNSFRTLLRRSGVRGVTLAAKALNHALLNRHPLCDQLNFEWSNGLSSFELSEFSENYAFMELEHLFRERVPVNEFKLKRVLDDFSKTIGSD